MVIKKGIISCSNKTDLKEDPRNSQIDDTEMKN